MIQKYSQLHKQAAATKEQILAVSKKLGKTPEEIIQLTSEVDPTKKYEVWLLKQMALGYIALPENAELIKSTLKNFERLNNNKQLKFTNINQYKSFQILKEEIQNLKKGLSEEVFDSSVQKLLNYEGVSIFAQDEKWFILRIKEVEPLMEAADSTSWCTRHEPNAENYLKNNGDQFVVYEKKQGKLNKFAQFAEDFRQFQNVDNKNILENLDPTLISLIVENMKPSQELLRFCRVNAVPEHKIKEIAEKLEQISLKKKRDAIHSLDNSNFFLENKNWLILLISDKTIQDSIMRNFDVISYNIRQKLYPYLIFQKPTPEDYYFYAAASEDFAEVLDREGHSINYLNEDAFNFLKRVFPEAWNLLSRHPQGLYTQLNNNKIWEGNCRFYKEDFPFEIELPEGFTVNGDLDLRDSYTYVLPKKLTVKGNLIASDSLISFLPEDISVGKSIYLENLGSVELPDNLIVKGSLSLNGTGIEKLPSGLVVHRNLDLGYTGLEKLSSDLICKGSILGFNSFSGVYYQEEYDNMRQLTSQIEYLEKKYDK